MSKVLKRSRRAAPEGDEEHWIPLSDLMTSLMFLFLLIALAYMVQVTQQSTQTVKIVDAYRLRHDALYDELNREFGRDLHRWGAELSPDLTIRFARPGALFEPGSATLQPRFRAILQDFFPRYIRIIDSLAYRRAVQELRIEGTASPDSRAGLGVPTTYIGNMELAQDRSREVLAYVLPLAEVEPHRAWLTSHITADGLASSHPFAVHGSDSEVSSQRVDFRIIDPLWDRIAQDPGSQSGPAAPTLHSAGSARLGQERRLALPYSIDAVVAPGTAPILINLDMHPIVHVNGQQPITILGWATLRGSNAPAGGVFVTVDGARQISATYGLERDDVASALRKPTSDHVGFTIDIPAKSLGAGQHQLDFIVQNVRGQQDYIARDRLTLISE